jgi:hypothetical protein
MAGESHIYNRRLKKEYKQSIADKEAELNELLDEILVMPGMPTPAQLARKKELERVLYANQLQDEHYNGIDNSYSTIK